MSAEEVKAHAVEAVRAHLELSDKTRLRFSLFQAVAICLTIIGATWSASWAIGTRLRDISDGQSRLESALSYRVSVGQFNTWRFDFDQANRAIDGGKGVKVPPLPSIQNSGGASSTLVDSDRSLP